MLCMHGALEQLHRIGLVFILVGLDWTGNRDRRGRSSVSSSAEAAQTSGLYNSRMLPTFTMCSARAQFSTLRKGEKNRPRIGARWYQETARPKAHAVNEWIRTNAATVVQNYNSERRGSPLVLMVVQHASRIRRVGGHRLATLLTWSVYIVGLDFSFYRSTSLQKLGLRCHYCDQDRITVLYPNNKVNYPRLRHRTERRRDSSRRDDMLSLASCRR